MTLSALAALLVGVLARLRDPEERALWRLRLRTLRPAKAA